MRTSRVGMAAVGAALALGLTLGAPSPAHAQRSGQGEDDSAALVSEGRDALRAGKLADAGKALDQAIALNPRRVEAYVLRSAVYAATKQYAAGIALMRRAQELAPGDEEVLTALGSQLVLSGDARAGVPLLQQVTAANPRRYDAQLLLAHHFHAMGKWPDAIGAFESYFANRPPALATEDARHQIELADSYLRFRQPEKARVLFERALASRGTDLRARVGVAWATAALDCRKARPLLRELETIATSYPEVWLVDGQCALALGDSNGGLALGRRYLEKSVETSATGSAAGHALVGEAQAARGNLPEARRELEMARQLEPQRRRWAVRLAVVLRRAGNIPEALATLDALGPPPQAGVDPDWWYELGETLLAKNDAATAVTRLTPAREQLPGDAQVRTLLGAAQLAAGQPEAAIATLDEAEQLGSTLRSRQLLSRALATVAVNDLGVGDIAAGEQKLARAEALDPTPVVLKDLGIARLALERPADAVGPLDRAYRAAPTGVVAMLAARAHALTGDLAGARPLYERAASDKDVGVEAAIDWAASELASGDAQTAVSALEKTASAARGGALAARHKEALATARHAAGVVAIRAGNGPRAMELMKNALAADPTLPNKCDYALATVVAGETSAGLTALRAVAGQSCPFPAPADVQAAPILAAFIEGVSSKRAGKALDKLTSLGGRSSGPAAVLLNTSIRVVALEAAQDAYRSGANAAAQKYLATARGANTRVGQDEVAHNLAVLELAEGRVDAAIAGLEKVAAKVPEAYVSLGIAYEKKGDPQKALEMWRRARKAGVRFAPLAEWIETKERVYGAAP